MLVAILPLSLGFSNMPVGFGSYEGLQLQAELFVF